MLAFEGGGLASEPLAEALSGSLRWSHLCGRPASEKSPLIGAAACRASAAKQPGQ
jgi:hypothetical protein